MELFFVIAGAILLFLVILSFLLDKNSGFGKLAIFAASSGFLMVLSTSLIWLASLVITNIFNVKQLTFTESFGVLFVIILIRFAIRLIK